MFILFVLNLHNPVASEKDFFLLLVFLAHSRRGHQAARGLVPLLIRFLPLVVILIVIKTIIVVIIIIIMEN